MMKDGKQSKRTAGTRMPKALQKVTGWLKTSTGRQLLMGGLAAAAAVALGRNKRVRNAAATVGKEARDAASGAVKAVKRAATKTSPKTGATAKNSATKSSAAKSTKGAAKTSTAKKPAAKKPAAKSPTAKSAPTTVRH